MKNYIQNSCIYVNLYTVAENIRALDASVGERCSVIPVLKGDAFGLGLLPMAKCITAAVRVPYIAVAHISEGVELREGGINTPVLVLGGILPEQYETAVRSNLTVSASRIGMLPRLGEFARMQGRRIDVHIAIDTGLGRYGVHAGDELAALLSEIKTNRDCIRVTGTYSHFADAETLGSPRTATQYIRYCEALEEIKKAGIDPGLCHLSNSAASEYMPGANFGAIRVGRRLFFDNPAKPLGTVREAASWRTRVTGLRQVAADEAFGYGSGLTLGHDGTVALIGVGYGDGLRHDIVRAHAPVLLHGVRVPLLGMCMDTAFIDATGVPCGLGDEVTMFGYSGEGDFLSAQEVAAYAGDEGCGLTCNLLPRVKRIYE